MVKLLIILAGFVFCAAVSALTALVAATSLALGIQDIRQQGLEVMARSGAGVLEGMVILASGLAFYGARACWRQAVRLRSPPKAPEGFLLADPALRMRALGIDSLLLLPIIILPFIMTAAPGRGSAISAASNLSYLLFQAYCIAMLAWRGQTLGKMTQGIRVVRRDGAPLGSARALMRSSVDLFWTVLLVSQGISGLSFDAGTIPQGLLFALPCFAAWYLADYLSMIFGPHRLALHDHIGGTMVLYLREEGTL